MLLMHSWFVDFTAFSTLYCVFEEKSPVKDCIIQTWRHVPWQHREFDCCRGGALFIYTHTYPSISLYSYISLSRSLSIYIFSKQAQHCESWCASLFFIIIVLTPQLLGACHCFVSAVTVCAQNDVGLIVPGAHTSVHICGIFPSNKLLSPTNEHML